MIKVLTRAESLFETACLSAGQNISVAMATFRTLPGFKRRWAEIVNQSFRATYGSLPVCLLTALFSGMILAFQTGIELQRYGQEASIGFVVAASMCREMGPVMTAIALAGLMGSSYAAELGTMRVSEEIDALEVMSIDPIRFLVMPRMFALITASVAMTIIVNAVGIVGGAAIGKANFNVGFEIYFQKAEEILKMRDIWQGVIKSFCFGMSTSIIACTQGMNAGQGAEGVGRATQKTVVLAFIYILVTDHLVNFLVNLVGNGPHQGL